MTPNDAIALIGELVQIVGRWQPDFAQKIVGAPAESIDQLEARSSVLPAEHRAFLERMGAHYEGINAYGDDVLDLRASALLEFGNDDYSVDPRQFVLCGAPSDFLVWPLMFDRRAPIDPLPLVRFGGLDEDNANQPLTMREHSSFVAMLFAFAFMQKCLAGFAWERHVRSPGTKQPQFPNSPPGRWLPHFGVITQRLGFVPIPHTGPWTICAERGDAAVMMYECPGFAPDVRVAAREQAMLNNLVEILCDNLELVPKPATLRQPP